MRSINIAKYLNIIESTLEDCAIYGATLDSRTVKPNMIFFASSGKNVDGNQYAQQALSKGAAVVIMDDPISYAKVVGNKILVKNTIDAIYQMAKRRLEDTKALKIAITGSFGKTSTKEIVASVLATKYKVQVSDGNHNNLLGVSLTACGIADDTEVAVFEMGTNAIGEIQKLSALISPNIAILTGVGYAHIGNFGGIAQTMHEKLSLVDNLSGVGAVIANEQFAKGLQSKSKTIVKQTVIFGNETAADVRLSECNYDGKDLTFSVDCYGDIHHALLHYPYRHIAINFLAGFALAKLLDIPFSAVIKAANEYEIVDGRGSVLHIDDLTIINDTYNASLEAVKAAVKSLSIMTEKPKYALIGEIGEINGYETQIYNELMQLTNEYPSIHFIFSGAIFAMYSGSDNTKIVISELETKALLNEVKQGVLLVKASHSKNFEKYINYMKAVLIEDAANIGGLNAI